MHQAPTPQPYQQGNDAPLHAAMQQAQQIVGRRRHPLSVVNLGQTAYDLDCGVDFFSWHGAMTRAKQEGRGG